MAKKHDENQDVNALIKLGLIKEYEKTNKVISAPKDAVVGIKQLGRIDFLIHYRGWTFIRTAPRNVVTDDKPRKRKQRKTNKYENIEL